MQDFSPQSPVHVVDPKILLSKALSSAKTNE